MKMVVNKYQCNATVMEQWWLTLEDTITHGVITMSLVIGTAGVGQLMLGAVVTDPASAAPGRRTCHRSGTEGQERQQQQGAEVLN